MNRFVQGYLQELDIGRVNAILSILNKSKKEGKIKTRREFDRMLDRLLDESSLTAYEKSFTPVMPYQDTPVIQSQQFNDNLYNVYKDLYALFEHMSGLSTLVDKHDNLIASELNRAYDVIHKLLEEVAIFRFKKANPEWNEVKYNAFSTGRNLTEKRVRAQVDPRTRKLTLPVGNQVVYTDDRDSTGPTITITCLSHGDTGVTNAEFKPENALDSLESSFWAEALLSDGLITTSYNGTEYQGAVFEALVTMQNVKRFNSIEVLPFGAHPVEIIDVQISEDGTSYSQWDGFESLGSSTDWLSYKSIATNAKYVKIVFFQENYIKKNYLLPTELVSRTDIWEHILDDELSRADSNNDLNSYDERNRKVDKGFNAFIDAQRKLDKELLERDVHKGARMPEYNHSQVAQSIANVMLGDTKSVPDSVTTPLPGDHEETAKKSEFTEIQKYEYVLGAYDIRISHVSYPKEGFYRSQKYAPRGSIITTRLHTDETHEVDGSDRLTSTEYTLHLSENKALPIMPYGTTRIYNEKVYINPSTMTGETRFTPTGTYTVSLNDKTLTESVDYSMSSGTITLFGFELVMMRSSYVTVSYDVTYSDLDIDSQYDAKPMDNPLEFSGTNERGVLELPYAPYIEREIIISDSRTDTAPIWERTDPKEGIWYPRRTAGPQKIGGYWYGAGKGNVYSYDTGTHYISLTNIKGGTVTYSASGLGFPDSSDGQYYARVGETIARVQTTAAGKIEVLETGYEGTAKYSLTDSSLYATDTPVEFIAFRKYEPIMVYVGGAKARNITNYKSKEQEAFARTSSEETNYEYIQSGRTIYFNTPIPNEEIKINYYYKAKYAQLQVVLRGSDNGELWTTPVISSYKLALQTVRR